MPQLLSAPARRRYPPEHRGPTGHGRDGARLSFQLTTALPGPRSGRPELVVSVLGTSPIPTPPLPLRPPRRPRARTSDGLRRSHPQDRRRRQRRHADRRPPRRSRQQLLPRKPDLTPFQDDQNQLWWGYDPRIGLTFTAIDTSVYHEAMAIRLTEPPSRSILPTRRVSRLDRRQLLPRSTRRPTTPTPATRRRAATRCTYAVAAGSSTAQPRPGPRDRRLSTRRWARKGDRRDRETAGGNGLWEGLGSQTAARALRYLEPLRAI